MSTDLSQFHGIFYEESFELLESMEAALLELSGGNDDIELVHTIFRAAHSIKGGAGTFGFTQVAGFTHVMETLLDEIRNGNREANMEIVGLLLESGDLVQGMLEALRDGEEADDATIDNLLGRLNEQLDGSSESNGIKENTDKTAVSEKEAQPGWKIVFKPHREIMKSGNDPLRILKELDSLGELEVTPDLSELPDFSEMDPEAFYLGWNLFLKGNVSREQIVEIFEWVEGECDLEIEAFSVADDDAPAAKSSEGTDVQAETAQMPTENEIQTTQAPAKPKDDNPAEPATVKKAAKKPSADGGSIRVGIDKIDALINQVGELVITQSMLSQVGGLLEEGDVKGLEKLRDGLAQLERNTRDLQESVLQVRMLPINVSFSRFPRLVRDLSLKMGKQVELKLTGEHTEVDKTVLEKIGDPLVHLVRNSLDHGLEMPDIRSQAGKPETGILELRAYHEGSDIVIEVIDDGAGLNKDKILSKAIEKNVIAEGETLSDEEIYSLIFKPGFSTADTVSDVSGRGVGMDVVRRNIRDLGGNVSITSQVGKGSKITIRLPLTLAILDGQLVAVSDQVFIVSLVSIVESIQVKPENISSIAGKAELYKLRGEYIPIIRLGNLFEIEIGNKDLQQGLLVIVEADGKRVGLFVDDLMGQQQVVVKSLETNYRQIQGISGATILGDGHVALIMDVAGLIQRHFDQCNSQNVTVSAVA